jgi:dTDP-4-amino-4,6-dideoxygalactose transaminase
MPKIRIAYAVMTIPIMRPKLPCAEQVGAYLKKIDSTRIYSNFGPLVSSFEDRLASHFGLDHGMVTTVVNATIGLTIALAAQDARPATLCLMPSWTFIASAHAAVLAGLVPYFVDVDPNTWALNPDQIDEAISQAPGIVGAVMPVAPFGRAIDVTAWDRFRARSGVPVVIDAAAGFDCISPSKTPVVVSLHATKVLGVGEGGFVICTDSSIIRNIRTRTNFGFVRTREAAVPAVNGKLSEYHAAVGLAALDHWVDMREEWMAVAQAYREALPESNGLYFQEGFGTSWITSTCILRFANVDANRVESKLAEAGIETRQWWGQGAHTHAATGKFPRCQLPETVLLAQATLAVPFFSDLGSADIHRISEIILDREQF